VIAAISASQPFKGSQAPFYTRFGHFRKSSQVFPLRHRLSGCTILETNVPQFLHMTLDFQQVREQVKQLGENARCVNSG
jgi:hypothetical protein